MSISNRIQRLEGLLATGGRMIVCSQPRDMTDEQLEQYLTSQGISTQLDDLVVSLKRFSDGHPNPWIKLDDRDV
jgi:hypothetical protein